MASPRRPPIAGRPPFATDEDDSVYDNAPAPQRRLQKPQQPQNGARDSTYQAWDQYLQDDKHRNSGAGGIGMGLMNADMDDDSDDERPKPRNPFHNAAADEKNRALFAAATSPPPQMSSLSSQPLARPPPVATRGPSFDRQAHQQPQQEIAQPRPRPPPAGLRVETGNPAMPIPRAPMPAFMMQAPPSPSPSLNPHPLNAPSTPITPVFARPSFQGSREVKFTDTGILRGNSEETLLARNTHKGEEFWKRFSFVAKEQPKQGRSSWLKRYQAGNTSMSRWVWCISIILLIAIGGAIGLGLYFTRDQPASLPVALEGGENNAAPEPTDRPIAEGEPTPTSRSLSAVPAVETKRDLGFGVELEARSVYNISRKRHSARVKARHNRMVMEELD